MKPRRQRIMIDYRIVDELSKTMPNTFNITSYINHLLSNEAKRARDKNENLHT